MNWIYSKEFWIKAIEKCTELQTRFYKSYALEMFLAVNFWTKIHDIFFLFTNELCMKSAYLYAKILTKKIKTKNFLKTCMISMEICQNNPVLLCFSICIWHIIIMCSDMLPGVNVNHNWKGSIENRPILISTFIKKFLESYVKKFWDNFTKMSYCISTQANKGLRSMICVYDSNER